MTLFFESGVQAACFLAMAPVGFLAALMLDADVIAGRMRAAADVMLLLLAGAAALGMIALAGESGLRVYHLLGLLVGAILYTQGVGRVLRLLVRKTANSSRRQESHTRAENGIYPKEKG